MSIFTRLFKSKTKAVPLAEAKKAAALPVRPYVAPVPMRRVPVQSFTAPSSPPAQSGGIGIADVVILNALMNSGHSSASRASDACASEPSPSYSSGGSGDFGGGGVSSSWSDSSSSSSSYSSSDSSSSSSSDSGSSSCSSSD